MKVLVRHLLKKTRAGGYAEREETIEAPSIRFGRGAECELHLTDPRVLLHHAEMTERPAGVFLESVGAVDFQVNGKITSAARIGPGDTVQMGPYDLKMLDVPEGYDASFTFEYARELGDELAALRERSNTKLTRVGMGLRGWAWLMFLLAVGFGIGAPLAAYYTTPRGGDPMMSTARDNLLARADEIWLSGPISGVHSHFGNQCETCHVNAFEQVTNTVCLDCHDDAGHHADPVAFPVGSLAGQQCASCHKEHTDGEDLVISSEAFCVDCHQNFSEVAADSRLMNVSGFDTHPEFHPTLIVDHEEMTFERVSVAADPPPVDRSNLKFTHAEHLRPEGMRGPDGTRVLECGDCHQPETGGIAMLPVVYDDACAGCHRLQFEPASLDRSIPHGDVEVAMQYVRDTYSVLALRGGYQGDDADAPAVVRRLVGEPISDTEREDALAWADAKAAEVLESRFGRGLCANCHEIVEGNGPADWDVAPVHLTTLWLPKGYFTHREHRDRSCTTCHAAPESEQASDVLLPSIATCQECHGGEFATGRTRTACTDCHGFHREDLVDDMGDDTALMRWE